MYRAGTIRLRLRVHGLYALHDLHRARPALDSTLCDLHRLYGARITSARRLERQAPGDPRLPALFHLGDARHHPRLHRHRPDSTGPGVWEEETIMAWVFQP